jgi:hypothetical protein
MLKIDKIGVKKSKFFTGIGTRVVIAKNLSKSKSNDQCLGVKKSNMYHLYLDMVP